MSPAMRPELCREVSPPEAPGSAREATTRQSPAGGGKGEVTPRQAPYGRRGGGYDDAADRRTKVVVVHDLFDLHLGDRPGCEIAAIEIAAIEIAAIEICD